MNYRKLVHYGVSRLARLPIVSDEHALGLLFYVEFGRALNLKNPQTFNEKLQWLKLHDRKSIYGVLVDKYAVKEWVSEQIGTEFVTPTYGVWDNVDDIDISSLPEQFVLKTNHDSGGVVICKNRTDFSLDTAKRKLKKSLKRNYYWNYREWPYKNINPLVFAEEYLDASICSRNNKITEATEEMIDYKFYCFNGVPRFLYVSQGLENHKTARISFLDIDWSFAPFVRNDYANFSELPAKPKSYNEMLALATKLSEGIPFVRVDFFEYLERPRFSEMTFYPCAGFMKFSPDEWDKRVGDMLDLSMVDRM